MDNCLFCRIVKGEIPAKKAYEDDHVLAFHDINPQAAVHILIIPKQHCASIRDLPLGELPSHLMAAVQRVAQEAGVAESGFRVITNSGPDSGQEVAHLHFHLLGGQPLGPLVSLT